MSLWVLNNVGLSVQSQSHNHLIDFDNASVTNKGAIRVRKTFESWQTANINEADMNSNRSPKRYSIILN